MSNNFNVSENMSAIFEKLEKFLTTKTVVGEPMKIGDTTIIPLVSISFGLGSGGGDGQDEKSTQGSGGGSASGARIAPAAMLVIQGDKVELLPVKKNGGLDKLVEMVPGIIEKISDKAVDKKCCE